MGLRPDTRYTGTVSRGSLVESNKGTPGFELLFECEEGSMMHTIWLTPATIDKGYAQRDFAVFDVTEDQLQSESFLRDQLPLAIVGKPVTFGTKEEEYKGEVKVKCAWIGKPKAPGAATLEGSVAAMFRGDKSAPAAPSQDFADDDIPF